MSVNLTNIKKEVVCLNHLPKTYTAERAKQHAEAVAKGLYKDKRWGEVSDLRSQGLHTQATNLVIKMKEDWGIYQ